MSLRLFCLLDCLCVFSLRVLPCVCVGLSLPCLHSRLSLCPGQCSLSFLKVCVRIKFLLCNILPGLVCIWNYVYDICAKTFLEGTVTCAPSFLVCARLTVNNFVD